MDFINFEFSESSGVHGELRLVKSLLLLLPRTPHLLYGPENGRKGRKNAKKRRNPGGRGDKNEFVLLFPMVFPHFYLPWQGVTYGAVQFGSVRYLRASVKAVVKA